MPVKFLTEEWAQAVTEALQNHEQFRSSASMSLQFVVTEAPGAREAHFFLDATGEEPLQALGKLENPDITISATHDTAQAIFSGELNTQMAFMTGKIKVKGNLAKLISQQVALGQWSEVMANLDVEF